MALFYLICSLKVPKDIITYNLLSFRPNWSPLVAEITHLHLVFAVKIGMDLTKVVLPTFILER